MAKRLHKFSPDKIRKIRSFQEIKNIAKQREMIRGAFEKRKGMLEKRNNEGTRRRGLARDELIGVRTEVKGLREKIDREMWRIREIGRVKGLGVRGGGLFKRKKTIINLRKRTDLIDMEILKQNKLMEEGKTKPEEVHDRLLMLNKERKMIENNVEIIRSEVEREEIKENPGTVNFSSLMKRDKTDGVK